MGTMQAALRNVSRMWRHRRRRTVSAHVEPTCVDSTEMFALRLLLSACAALSCSVASALALDTDIAVALSASPTTGLHSGDVVTFTWSVTNHGPNPAPLFGVLSSEIRDEFDVRRQASDCSDMTRAVGDGGNFVVYSYFWYPTRQRDLAVGETVRCHLSLPLGDAAPLRTTFAIQMPPFELDRDLGNNLSSVVLERAEAEVPLLAAPARWGLFVGLLGAGARAIKTRRCRPSRPRAADETS
jgi:hypothetical protein